MLSNLSMEVDQKGKKQFCLADDLTALEKKIIEIGSIAAIFIDPVSSYLGGRIDEYKNAVIRSVLTPLAKLAEKYRLSIICVTHLNKNETQSAINRVAGSIGYIAAARSAFLVVKDKINNNKRLFLPIKINIAKDTTGLAFYIESCTIENNITTSRLAWSKEIITQKADELLSAHANNEDKGARSDAKDFLCELLANDKMYANDIIDLAKSEGISEKTLRRAKDDLGIEIYREGFGTGSK